MKRVEKFLFMNIVHMNGAPYDWGALGEGKVQE